MTAIPPRTGERVVPHSGSERSLRDDRCLLALVHQTLALGA